jgi:hypothetical protein
MSRPNRRPRSGLAAMRAWIIALTVPILAGGCVDYGGPNPYETPTSNSTAEPPERDFDQAGAWEIMEAAAAEAIEDLPDFPGFEVRTIDHLSCSSQGITDPDYVNLELTYEFSPDVSQDPLVRENYVVLLRQKWTEAGYEITTDSQNGSDPVHYELEAVRPDGVVYWYNAAGLTWLTIQSGCVKSTGGREYNPPCPIPLGGVTRENDRATKYCDTTDLVYPDEGQTANAVAPFESTQTLMIPWQKRAPGELGNQR